MLLVLGQIERGLMPLGLGLLEAKDVGSLLLDGLQRALGQDRSDAVDVPGEYPGASRGHGSTAGARRPDRRGRTTI